MQDSWQFWIDRGGTFTDIIACLADGQLIARKLLSDAPEQYADAAVAGIALILAEHPDTPAIDAIRIGTTVATNALLERRGEPTALVITTGFGDALRIAYQNRPDLFALNIQVPEPLYSAVVEVDERIDASGKILLTLDTNKLEQDLKKLQRQGINSVAICFMHGYRYTQHEISSGAIAKRLGFQQISLSHEVSALRKLVSRGDTTVADAYLSPVLKHYVNSLRSGLRKTAIEPAQLLFMQSNGGLVDADDFRGKDSVLSGPAGGVAGMAHVIGKAGYSAAIGFDMGGTSTDVSLFAGTFETVSDHQIAGIRLRSPMLKVHTIAAGGGSLLKFESGRFQVGPESAGSAPGPVSYRQGGSLTVTDANLLLGRIVPEFFPCLFGPNADQPLDTQAVDEAFRMVTQQVNRDSSKQWSAAETAEGFLHIAIDNMANAIRHISIQRGYDPADFVLCCFGGASGQHACQVANTLGITEILVDPMAGVLSALGIGISPLRNYRQKTVETALSESSLAALLITAATLEQECQTSLTRQHASPEGISFKTCLNIKTSGSDTTLEVPMGSVAAIFEQFEQAHRRRFGFVAGCKELMIDSLRVDATASTTPITTTTSSKTTGNGGSSSVLPEKTIQVFHQGEWRSTPVYQRYKLAEGVNLSGPAIIVEANTTIVVEAGWILEVNEHSQLMLRRTDTNNTGLPVQQPNETEADPVTLEIFNHQFMHIAERMGMVLMNTAHSVNIKERLDFSCALFDHQAQLIANAPHMPVHLGSMGDSVMTILTRNSGTMRPGDVFMLNDPFHGGTHLPDITLITPCFSENNQDILFFIACRAHHADIGGITPGSMPATSTTLQEEGVLFDNFKLVDAGRLAATELESRLSAGPYPARNVRQNIADLKAQIAANETGILELRKLIGRFSLTTVLAYTRHIQDNAEQAVRNTLGRLHEGSFEYPMDNGAVIRVSIRIDHNNRQAVVDFTGTSAQTQNNFNAPTSICRAAVLYVFRTLVNADIPLNAGCLKPVQIILPENSLLSPDFPAAVVAGNVETSQCITNALYGALGVLSAAQGTMNNLTFGNDQYQYYETICGGAGAGRYFDGADAIHTHMTNSRMTDPEVLEARFPVILREFSIRHGSGGAGQYRGGHGVIRKIEFLEKLSVSILSGHRRIAPFGLGGGQPGKPGHNNVLRQDGQCDTLSATDETVMNAGDILVIETPGGGGFGSEE